LSLFEDAVAIGSSVLLVFHPVVILVVLVVFLPLVTWIVPKIFGALRALFVRARSSATVA
jgi:hypothetical protein